MIEHLDHMGLRHLVANSTNQREISTGGYFGGWDLDFFNKDSSIRVESFCLLYFISMIIIFALGFKIVLFWRMHHLPEAGLAMIVGTIFSLMTYSAGHHDIANGFDGNFFFWFLLPPIIFQSGYAQDRNPFFSNWSTIFVFANVGTLISTVVFGYGIYWVGLLDLSLHLPIMECLAFGALISSTDPVSTLGVFAELKVDPALRAIIYGSSAFDDAVAIVTFKAFQKYIYAETLGMDAIFAIIFYLIICIFASFTIGVLFGVFAAWCIKSTNIRGEKRLLICFSVCFVYISYFSCTVLELSGIISCIVSAIAFRYCLDYGEILTETDVQALDLSLSAFAYFLETFTFFAMGMSMGSKILEKKSDVDVRFLIWSLLFSTISRGAYVYPLSFLCNLMNGKSPLKICSSRNGNPDEPTRLDIDIGDGGYDIYKKDVRSYKSFYLSLNKQHMIVFAGLRGPIAYAAAQLYPADSPNVRNIYFATTVIVVVNIFFQGSLTEFALKFLDIEHTRNQATAVAPLETDPCTDTTDSRGGAKNNTSRLLTKATNSECVTNRFENCPSRRSLSRREDRGCSRSCDMNDRATAPTICADKDLEAGEAGIEVEIPVDVEVQDEEVNIGEDKLVENSLSEKQDDRSDRPYSKESAGDGREAKAWQSGTDDPEREDSLRHLVEKGKARKESAILRGSAVFDGREPGVRRLDSSSTGLFRKFETYVLAPLFRSNL